MAAGARLHGLVKPMLGLFNGRPGARQFRRHLSENAVREGADLDVLTTALDFVRQRRAA
jgi:tRNA-dihydrouridine synthase A